MAFALLHLLEEAVEEAVEVEEVVDKGVMAITCLKARSRPGRVPGRARLHTAMPT